MDEKLKLETEKLKLAWLKQDNKATALYYLIKDPQDGRINIQSILCRGWLIKQMFGDKFSYVTQQELRFALVMHWIDGLYNQKFRLTQLQSILYSLIEGMDKSENIEIPSYISQTFTGLELPNYICDLLNFSPVENADTPVPGYFITTFERIWSEILAQEQPGKISVLEPACGAANDYRFLKSFGISGFLDYTGFDLSDSNIMEAKQMFPNVKFKTDNIFEIQEQAQSFDYCFVNDLFEYLSIDALEVAVQEICRVTRKGICVSFFNMHKDSEHIIKPVDLYYNNTLSAPVTAKLFEQHFSKVEVIHIDEFLAAEFGCNDTKNKNAFTFYISA